jgi:arylsulfatase
MPDKLKEMRALFLEQARKFNMLPLDNSAFERAITPRPNPAAGQTVFTYYGVMPRIPTGVARAVIRSTSPRAATS